MDTKINSNVSSETRRESGSKIEKDTKPALFSSGWFGSDFYIDCNELLAAVDSVDGGILLFKNGAKIVGVRPSVIKMIAKYLTKCNI